MGPWQLEWFDPSRPREALTRVVATPGEALKLFDDLAVDYPFDESCIAPCLRATDGAEMLVGLAGDHWLLTHVGTGDCEYSWAVGDSNAAGTLWVFYPADTEVSHKLLIQKAEARRAITEWMDTGRLGGGLTWTANYHEAS